MRKCIATVSVSGTLGDKLDAIAAARFDAIEVFENDLMYFRGSPRDIARMAADRGLGIDLYQPFREFEGAGGEQFRRNLDRAERKFDVMEALGAPMLLVCSNVSPLAIDDDARAAAQLHELAERAARRNLRIGYEALAWGTHVNRYGHSWKIVREADHPHLGVILDSFHILSVGDDPAAIAQIPGDRIFFLQMADAPRLAMDVLQWSRHYRNFPGQGQLDLPRFMEHVLVAGYTGSLSLEIFNDVFREAPNRSTAIDAMRSLQWLEEQTRLRLLDAASDSPHPAEARARTVRRVELLDPPAAPVLTGVAFLEFAVDEAAEWLLANVLETLGFHRAGRHRSKNVTLYRQGSINLILNAEPASVAREYFAEHGASVCAVGLATDDAVRAQSRATALHCPRFDSRLGPNELRVPAIRAPNDSVIYFVPGELGSGALFESDFDLRDEAAPREARAGLTSVDHIATGLPVEELDTWILFYRAVLGMVPGESLELSDPFGLIRSSGVASGNRSVRAVLNVSQSQSTVTAKTVSLSGGASIHHVAFASSDIFETMATLVAGGAKFVMVSANYYDDLVARFALPEAQVARMREFGVLYERTGGGEYFHAYTERFADRFFFEIVQRVGGYDGYGALNAPARMASQLQQPAS
ncbi:MAG: bifunctional sugar phosphate isomerase/epimerase/4-hydroxyphenylpyruvate dioxygenase family protein [Casimicrobiaceae bacterium]